MESDGVRKACNIQPPHRHALAKARRSEQPIHLLFVGIRRSVGVASGDLLRRRRQAGEIERKPAQELGLRRFRGGRDLSLRELRADETIHRMRRFARRHRRFRQRRVSPVRLVNRAFRDPAFDRVFLLRRQLLVRLRRRHDVVAIIGKNACDDFTLLRLTRHDRHHIILRFLQRFLTNIQPQPGLPRLRIEAVAVKAGVRKNRPNIAVKADRSVLGLRRADGEQADDKQEAEKGRGFHKWNA